MHFGKIDVVVKSEGIIRPNEQISTVKNGYTGIIEKVNTRDGESVEEGDILYTIKHTELLTEKEYITKQIEEATNNLQLLEKYKQSVKEDKNYFADIPEEEEYYTKFLNYYINYKSTEKGMNYSKEELGLNLVQTSRQFNDAIKEKSRIQKLKESIKKGKNLFGKQGTELEYRNIYDKFISDCKSLNLQYDKKKLEIDESTTEEGVINSIEYYNKKMEGLTTLQQSIKQNSNKFLEDNSYRLQYEEYRTKLSELESDYTKAKEDYEVNLELRDYGVSEWEVSQSKLAMNKAYNAISNYKNNYSSNLKSQITELKKTLKELSLSKENTLSKDVLYKNNESDRKEAIKNFELKYITELDSKNSDLTEAIQGLKENEENLNLQDGKDYIYKEEGGTQRAGNLLAIKNNELQITISGIKELKDQLTELEVTLKKLNETIDKCVVKAKMNGIINTNMELVPGDMLSEGTEVLTIIPADNSRYKVNVYVSNSDIGKIKEGMDIKCNVYALPNKEYGYLTGKIASISKDIKVDSENTSGYYFVEAALDNKKLYDYNGKEANLKAGMGCQAQIITGNKSILTFVLEKLDFLTS